MKITTSFTIRELILNQMETVAGQLNLNRSDIIRLAVEFGLNRDKSIEPNSIPKFFGYVKQKSFILEKEQIDKLYIASKAKRTSVSQIVNLYLYNFLSFIDNIAYNFEKAVLGYNEKGTKVIVCVDYIQNNIPEFYGLLESAIESRRFFIEKFYNDMSESSYIAISTKNLRILVKELLEKYANCTSLPLSV